MRLGLGARIEDKESLQTQRHPITITALRLLAATIVWLILLGLAVLSAIPYGGGSIFVILAIGSPPILLLAALWPLGRLIPEKTKDVLRIVFSGVIVILGCALLLMSALGGRH